LREPNRLRSWLCGIARTLITNAFRTQAREPACGAELLEAVQDAPSNEPLPSEHAITREEEAILWRSLERIPGLYREPLILFYREHQSVEQVAQALELSPDAVKQRLARGRKMLHDEVAAYVESALERTAPGRTFTLGVLAALPLLAASSATAATVGSTAAKVTLATKTAAAAGLTGAILGPVFGLLGAAYSGWCSVRNTRSPRERSFMMRQLWLQSAVFLIFMSALFAVVFLGKPLLKASPVAFGCLLGALVAGYVVGIIGWTRWINRRQRQIQLEDGTAGQLQAPQPPLSSRVQQLLTVYCSLGGSAIGAFSWLVNQAVRAGDWLTAWVTVLFGLAVVLVCGRAWMRRPERGFRVVLRALALFGLFTLVVCGLHLRDWTKAAGVQTTALQGVLVGSGLSFAVAVPAGFSWLRSRWAGTGRGRRGHNDRLPLVLLPLMLSAVHDSGAGANHPANQSWVLSNGVRVVSV